MTDIETIKKFMELYRGRVDAWGTVDGACIKEPVTEENYRLHLEGKKSLGVYPLLDDGTINFFAIDLDEKDFRKAWAIHDRLGAMGLPVYVASSKSKGYHVYGFCQGALPAVDIRRLLSSVLNSLKIAAEIFPKQDTLNEMTPLGNYINIPGFGKSVRQFLNSSQKPVDIDIAVLLIKRIIKDDIDRALHTIDVLEGKIIPPIKATVIAASPKERGRSKKKTGKHPPCIDNIMRGVPEGERDVAAFALARHLLDQQYTIPEVVGLLISWDNANKPPLDDAKLLEQKAVSAAKGYAFGCASILQEPLLAQFCVGKDKCSWLIRGSKDKQGKPNFFYKARFPALVDLVESEGKVTYLVLDNDGKLTLSGEVTGETCFRPPRKECLPFALPAAGNVLEYAQTDTDAALYQDLIDYFKAAAELPTDKHYNLIAWWVPHTYLYERFRYSPMLAFVGLPERGKSRLGRAIAAVSYRGIETETLREANLFRWSQDLGATIFLDVRDIQKKAEREKSEDVLLKRYEQGGKVARVLYPERGPFEDTVYFDIYGPTVIATNETVHNILDSRCLPIMMPLSPKTDWRDLDNGQALRLKERLVAFRARHMAEPLPNYPKPALGRLGDILQPLGVVMRLVSPNDEGIFVSMTRALWIERLQAKSQSREARLVAVLDEVSAQGDRVSIESITELYNKGLPTNHLWSPEKMGREVRKLGFKGGERRHGGTRTLIVDHELLAQLKTQWGLESPDEDAEEGPKIPSLSSQLSPQSRTDACSDGDSLVTDANKPTPQPSPWGQSQRDGSDSSLLPLKSETLPADGEEPGMGASSLQMNQAQEMALPNSNKRTLWGIPIADGGNISDPVFQRHPVECDCYRYGVLRCAVPCVWAWPPGAKVGDKAPSLVGGSG